MTRSAGRCKIFSRLEEFTENFEHQSKSGGSSENWSLSSMRIFMQDVHPIWLCITFFPLEGHLGGKNIAFYLPKMHQRVHVYCVFWTQHGDSYRCVNGV